MASNLLEKARRPSWLAAKDAAAAPKKAAAIEIGHFGHLPARFAVQFAVRGGPAIRRLPKSAHSVGAVKKEKILHCNELAHLQSTFDDSLDASIGCESHQH
jgi:hypothetical protein